VVPREENFASLYDKTTQVLHTEIFYIMRNYYDIFSYTKKLSGQKTESDTQKIESLLKQDKENEYEF